MSSSLKNVLSEMGMQDMFGTASDLSGISEDEKLAVSEVRRVESHNACEPGDTCSSCSRLMLFPSAVLFRLKVVHQATLDVDEVGATAAAATGVTLTPLSFRPIPVIKFNRPFMVLITESNHGSILFMGRIVNPNI